MSKLGSVNYDEINQRIESAKKLETLVNGSYSDIATVFGKTASE